MIAAGTHVSGDADPNPPPHQRQLVAFVEDFQLDRDNADLMSWTPTSPRSPSESVSCPCLGDRKRERIWGAAAVGWHAGAWSWHRNLGLKWAA